MIDHMLNGKDMIILLKVELIKKILYKNESTLWVNPLHLIIGELDGQGSIGKIQRILVWN